MVADPPA